MKKLAFIFFLMSNLLVLNNYAQVVIDSTNIDSLLLAKQEAYYTKTFNLEDSVFEVGSVLVEDIRFYFSKSGIDKKSFPFLDSLVSFLSKNTISIEVGYCTDYIGNDAYNKHLTEKRSEAIKYYIITNGITEVRIIRQGYGESKLIIAKEEIEVLNTRLIQEKAHALNRRTEFKIIKTN